MNYTAAIRRALISALLVSSAMSGAASPLDNLEEALIGYGMSSSRAAAILSEADAASWAGISPDADFVAVARSLTVASFANRLNPGELADLAYNLSQEAETLRRLGFTRREVARTLSEGVRGIEGAETLQSVDIPSQAAAAAAGLSRGSLRRDMREIAGRRGPSRGMIPPGVAQRAPDRPVPGGGRPVSNGPDGPEETPGTPDVPGGS